MPPDIQAGYNADAIDRFFDRSLNSTFGGPDTLHADPGSESPALVDADTDDLTFVESIVFNGGVAVTSQCCN